MIKDLFYFKSKNTLFVLFIVIILALFVRIYSINSENFDSDEGLTVYHSQKSILHNIKWSLSVLYVPFYHIILSSWVSLFGPTEFSTRMLSVIFGTLAVFMIYLIGTMLFNKKVGIFAALLVALSSFHVFFSQYSRPYSLYFFLSLLSIYFYFHYIHNKKFLLWYILTTIMLLYTHAVAPLLLVVQNLHYFLIVKERLKKWILIQLVLFVSYVPLLNFLITKSSSFTFLWIPTPSLLSIFEILYSYIAGETFAFYNLIFGLLLVLFFAALIGMFFIKKIKTLKSIPKKEFDSLFFIVILFFATLFLVIVYSFFFTTIFVDKYIIYSSLSIYILVALSIVSLRKPLQTIFFYIVIILLSSILYFDYATLNRAEIEKATDHIREQMESSDYILVSTNNSKHTFSYYYDKELFMSDDIPKALANKNIYGIKNSTRLPDILQDNPSSVWLVLYNAAYRDPNATIYNYLTSRYTLDNYKKFKGVAVYHFTNRNVTGVPLPDDYRAPLFTDPRLKSLKTFIKSRLRRA